MGATNNYGLPYSEEGDPPDGFADQKALAAAVDKLLVVENTTSGMVAASGFSTVTFFGARIAALGLVSWIAVVTPTGPEIVGGTPPGDNDNIGDTPLATVPSGWRPPWTINAVAGQGVAHGEATVHDSGEIHLRTFSAGQILEAGDNLRVSCCFIQPS